MHNVEQYCKGLQLPGISSDKIKMVADFKGVRRRFEYIIKTNDRDFIDDYAHHPEE
jgi:UDP-N-acetylmuramate--alanine ligase